MFAQPLAVQENFGAPDDPTNLLPELVHENVLTQDEADQQIELSGTGQGR